MIESGSHTKGLIP